MEPIRQLTGQDWEWEQEQYTMTELKKLVTSAPLLAYYDPSKELVIQYDASSTGLGSKLMQEGKPIAYASPALSTTEVGYAQIEKECLAIVFSHGRFRHFAGTFHLAKTMEEIWVFSTIVGRALDRLHSSDQMLFIVRLSTPITNLWRRLSRNHCAKHQKESKECYCVCCNITLC